MTRLELARVIYNALDANQLGAYVGRFEDEAHTCLDGDFDLRAVADAVLAALQLSGDA